jgi:hypothetical protein
MSFPSIIEKFNLLFELLHLLHRLVVRDQILEGVVLNILTSFQEEVPPLLVVLKSLTSFQHLVHQDLTSIQVEVLQNLVVLESLISSSILAEDLLVLEANH